MTYWIDLGPPTTQVMEFIGFNNFFKKIFLFNYTIKTDVHKIEHQSKNKHLFKTIIPIEKKQKSIMQFISQSINIKR